MRQTAIVRVYVYIWYIQVVIGFVRYAVCCGISLGCFTKYYRLWVSFELSIHNSKCKKKNEKENGIVSNIFVGYCATHTTFSIHLFMAIFCFVIVLVFTVKCENVMGLGLSLVFLFLRFFFFLAFCFILYIYIIF